MHSSQSNRRGLQVRLAARPHGLPTPDDFEIVYDETVIDGLASAPRALLDLVGGAFTGKTVVRLRS
ncbi:hypothetical protein [Streptomyces sp. HUAS TT20]|uniref:hypothetical protein n=1 Tax=Streptomyces sp. HUAS TT20 TaxID=3447509 RepID=UPI0021D95312|nr:hypothetical protein [Streptomyces sp. HUAS 15-9]UXY31109.1 hypothetical protein N8I87_34195 [Streptomyces sp. HUAS 15-9]